MQNNTASRQGLKSDTAKIIKRAILRTLDDLQGHGQEVVIAATADIQLLGRSSDVTKRTIGKLEELRNVINASIADLGMLETVWQSFPAGPVDETADPGQDGVPLHCTCGECDAGPKKSVLDAVVDAMTAAGILQGHQDTAAEPVAPQEFQDTAAPQPEEQNDDKVYVIGFPHPDMDPGLVRAKTVNEFCYRNDVRTRQTVGVAGIEHVVAGEPVLWISAVDGTKVAVPREKINEVAELMATLANGAVVAEPSA
jgi:hypothetical protein